MMLGAGPAGAQVAAPYPYQAQAPSTGLPPIAGPGEPAPPSPTVTRLTDWVTASGDNQGLPFAVIDKPAAEVFVFDATGDLVGSAPALLGVGIGDDSAPGVGEMDMNKIPMDERTTPAGRFVADLGPAKGMKSVLWVDFDDAVSLHPVIHVRGEHRVKRLASPSPQERRITHGCINVPVAFYKNVIETTFASAKGIVYVLPDAKPVDAVFPSLGDQAGDAGGAADPLDTLGGDGVVGAPSRR